MRVQAPEQYTIVPHRLGFGAHLACPRVYGHYPPSRSSVVEWVKEAIPFFYRPVMGYGSMAHRHISVVTHGPW